METLRTRGIRSKPIYDLGSPWADYRIPSTDALDGKRLSFDLDEGSTATFEFGTERLEITFSKGALESLPYDVTELRERVFFVQSFSDDKRVATTLVYHSDLQNGIFIRNSLVEGSAKAELEQDVYPAVVSGSGAAFPELTAELVGRRAYAEYADGHTAEHIYVNPRRLAWQGLGKFDYSGAELDHATTWKVDDRLYLLTWVEEWQAVAACLLLDYIAMRNVGVLFGQDDKGLVNTLCGARLHVLNDLDYPAGYEPPGVAGPSDQR